MPGATGGGSSRTRGRLSPGLMLVWLLIIASGVSAVGLAAWGWTLELGSRGEGEAGSAYLEFDIAVRSIKALVASDIYYNPVTNDEARPYLEIARALGVVFSLLVAYRLFVFGLGRATAEWWFRTTVNNHDVIIGDGAAASEYADAFTGMFGHKRRAVRISDEETGRIVGRVMNIERIGDVPAQLKAGVGRRARRIVVDEGDDSDTWQTAQLVAKHCPHAEVVAHISDPWMLDRLSREKPDFGLVAFSYSQGAARQAMLAHPPYLIARRYKAKAQHIVVVGFGQVGQAVAREFLVTSVHTDPEPMMITVIDIDAHDREKDFTARHPELHTQVDVAYVEGDFRQNDPDMLKKLEERFALSEPCGVFVAIDDAQKPLSMAYAIRAIALQRAMFRAPIFLCAQHGAGLAEVKQGIGLVGIETDPEERFQAESRAMAAGNLCDLRVVSFGGWASAFDGAGLLEPDLDGQAQRFHDTYQKLAAKLAAAAIPPRPAPVLQDWPGLPDQFRVSNRRAAAHIRAKAHVAGFDLNKWLETDTLGRRAHQLPPAADKLRANLDDPAFKTKMAELEHRRWMLDRLLDGWRRGPPDRVRDRYAKTHPDLVPFNELDGMSKLKDDNVVTITMEILEGASVTARK